MQDGTSPADPATALAGRHAVVTGGGSGIGAAIAERLHGLGASLTLVGRTPDKLAAQCARLVGAQFRVADVTRAGDVEALFEALEEPVTLLINAAGSTSSAPFHELTLEDWRETLAVNLDGVFHCCRAAISPMLECGYGRIVNIASTSALRGYRYVVAYCAAKHGVLGLTRALALELSRHDITVNAICPGFAETDLLRLSVDRIVARTGRSEQEARAELVSTNPQGRFIQPSEIAATVEWLVGEGARSVTGQAIAVCGGEVS